MKFPIKILLAISTTICILCMTSSSFAASDGSLGATSTGNSDLSVTIAELVQLTNVGDLSFGTFSGSGNMDQNDNVCVYRNDSAGQYTVTMTSSEGAFQVEDGAETIAYSAFWNDVTGLTGETAIVYNTQTATQSGANTSSLDCSAGAALNSNFHVRFAESALQAAKSGTYTGTLIILIEPA